MKKKKKNKIIIYLLLVILILVSIFLSTNIERKTNLFENYLKIISDNILNTLSLPIKEDKDESNSYIIEKTRNETLEEEIEELKKLLQLKSTYTDFDSVNATVLVRNKAYWLDTIIIDKGKDSNLKKDMAVITKEGMIGKIDKVYKKSSEVKLLTANSNNYKVSVLIKTSEGDEIGILNGYNNNLLKIKGINKNSKIKENDIVTTSGLGGVFPKGIYIGQVKKIQEDKYNLSKTVYIKTNQNYNNIHYVTVLRGKND